MSEQELRDGLKLAVADEPPMTFDMDDLVDTAERHARRRRALIAVGASTAAVAVAAVAVPVVLGIAGGPAEIPVATAPSSVVSTPATSTTPPKKPPLTRAQLVARGAEMQAHLREQMPVVVPGVKQVDVGLFGGEAEGAVSDGQDYLGSFVKFTLAAPTAIEVQVRDDQDGTDRDCTECTKMPQQDGSLVIVEPLKMRDGDPSEMKIKSATHFRNDGTSVRATTYNYDPTGQSGMIFQNDVALTVDQLTRLAVDPALHM